MPKIPRLNHFNGMIGALKKEAQVMREILNDKQAVHERKLIKNKQYRISQESKDVERLFHDLNDQIELVERLRPVGGKWDVRFGELVFLLPELHTDEADTISSPK